MSEGKVPIYLNCDRPNKIAIIKGKIYDASKLIHGGLAQSYTILISAMTLENDKAITDRQE